MVAAACTTAAARFWRPAASASSSKPHVSSSRPSGQRVHLQPSLARAPVRATPHAAAPTPITSIASRRAGVRAWSTSSSGSGSPHALRAISPAAQAVAPPTPEPQPGVQHVDFMVIGSGIAGLSYALKVADYGRVAVVTKDQASEGCTTYAQGGVCAVLDQSDSWQAHVRDTLVAGAHLNDPKAVEVVCKEGPARVLELVQMGAEFTCNQDGSLHLTKEGGHSSRRIVHAADMTGREIERALLAAARAHPNIYFQEHHLVVDLVVDKHAGMPHCFGADVLDQRSLTMTRIVALSTMLACGGAGQVFPNTTNPHVATGDGIAMAYRAQADVSNMEFVQFHPTALYDTSNTGRTFLITEAVRGEGGVLRNLAGERFMSKYDPQRMELAPRDVVARSIHTELLQRGDPYVLLDISHKPSDEILEHFPNIARKCAELGIDITRDPIPVTPAQHYTCGGVVTGLLGETSVQGLYACGEVACSGLHGANRLASNSLLEGLVFADRAAGPSVAHAEHAMRSCMEQLENAAATAGAAGPASPLAPGPAAWAERVRRELCDAMWRNCGIVRHRKGLKAALTHASDARAAAHRALRTHGVSTPLVELLNLATVAEITVSCALQRRESRGGHFCVDYPDMVDSECRPSLVTLRPAGRIPGGGVNTGGLGNLAALSSIASVPPHGVLASYASSTAAGLTGGGNGQAQQVLSGYPRALEVPVANNVTPASPSKSKAKKKGSSMQRDLSVRSMDKA